MSEHHACACKPSTWSAVLNTMPPGPHGLHVRGTVTCPTTGFGVALKKAVPQGINPDILILEIVETPPPGVAGQMITDHPVTYDEQPSHSYTEVFVRPCDLTIKVKVVS